MDDSASFGFDRYHLLLGGIGAVIMLAHWLPRFVSRREPAAAPLLLLFGMLAGWTFPKLTLIPDPRSTPPALGTDKRDGRHRRPLRERPED